MDQGWISRRLGDSIGQSFRVLGRSRGVSFRPEYSRGRSYTNSAGWMNAMPELCVLGGMRRIIKGMLCILPRTIHHPAGMAPMLRGERRCITQAESGTTHQCTRRNLIGQLPKLMVSV